MVKHVAKDNGVPNSCLPQIQKMNKRGCRCSENNRTNLIRLFLTIAHDSIFRYVEVNTGLLSYVCLFSAENIFQTL